MNKTNLCKWIVPVYSILIGCSEPPVIPEQNVDEFNTLIDIVAEPAGPNCATGGSKIQIGQDLNKNSLLETNEVVSINYICGGADGSSELLLSQTVSEPSGENCSAGGTKIEIGKDANTDGILSAEEVLSSFFVCHGGNGNGGQNGINGHSSILMVTDEPAGSNCENGGMRIEIGIDLNENFTLDPIEIQSNYFVCNGANGIDGLNTLSTVTSEPNGVNCASGGIMVALGLDSNQNGTLDSEEIVSENYLCHGSTGGDGTEGTASLIRTTQENAGENCEVGGLQFEVGHDSNRNNSLEDEEVQYTYFVCHGETGQNGSDAADGIDGYSTLIHTSTESSDGDCASGGIALTMGLDTNRNGSLDHGEEVNTYFICNGADGVDGKSVIQITAPAGPSCENGGTTFTFGYDNNADGDLEDEEDQILEVMTICNGADGSDGDNGSDGLNAIILTTAELSGTNCPSGGLRFQVGLDANFNNTLDEGEEVGTYYVCNGVNGADGSNGTNGSSSLINVESFTGSQGGCTNGGIIITTGLDQNNNGVLDNPTEIAAISYVCDGEDGASSEFFEFYFSEGLNGYSGVQDAAISDGFETETGEALNVEMPSPSANTPISNGLLYFPDLQEVEQEIGTSQFEIVEAILYLRGVSTLIDGTSIDNFIGAKILEQSAPLFDELECSWLDANSTETWSSPGAFVTEGDGAYELSDMFRLPHGVVFRGYIPLRLNRTEVRSWINDPETNKGLVLGMVAGTNSPSQIDIYSSNYQSDANYRPLLYIKARMSSENGRAAESDWSELSYKQKLAPIRKIGMTQ